MTIAHCNHKESYALTYYVFKKKHVRQNIYKRCIGKQTDERNRVPLQVQEMKCPNAHANGSLREVWSQPLLHDLSQWICLE